MKINVFKIIILLFLAGSFTTCRQWEWAPEPKTECDFLEIPNGMFGDGILPWVYEVIEDRLEKGIHGTVTQCNYSDGYGYLFEPIGNSMDIGYSFLTCDGTVLFEGKEGPIEDIFAKFNIERKLFMLGIYPSSEHEEHSDETPCHAVNPFTLPRVKELLYRCPVSRCRKFVSITTYKDGVGFLMVEHLRSDNVNWEFLDCSGNLLCQKVRGKLNDKWTELDIDDDFDNFKILIESATTLKYIPF